MKPFLNLLLFSLLSVTINGQVRNLVTERVYIRDSLRLKNRSIHEISIDATFSSATDKILATQKAIKDYVQNQIGNIDSLVKASNATGLFTPGHIPYIEGTGRLNARSFVELGAQSAPAAPSGGVRLFANGSNQLSWIGVDGYSRSFNGTLTGDRVYALPNSSGTLALLEAAQTWTGVQNFAPSGSGGAGFTYASTGKFSIFAPIMTDAQIAALTGGTAGGWAFSSTQARPYVHNGSGFQGVVLGPQAGFGSGQVAYGGVGGNLTSSNNVTWNGSVFATTGQITAVGSGNITGSSAGFNVGTGGYPVYNLNSKNAVHEDNTGTLALGRGYSTVVMNVGNVAGNLAAFTMSATQLQLFRASGIATHVFNTGSIGFGTASPSVFFQVVPSYSSTGDLSGAGYFLNINSGTATNTTTAASGTVNAASLNNISGGTIASTNTGVTYTAAATLRIGAAPTAGTNSTLTKSWAIQVASGPSMFPQVHVSQTGTHTWSQQAGIGHSYYQGSQIYAYSGQLGGSGSAVTVQGHINGSGANVFGILANLAVNSVASTGNSAAIRAETGGNEGNTSGVQSGFYSYFRTSGGQHDMRGITVNLSLNKPNTYTSTGSATGLYISVPERNNHGVVTLRGIHYGGLTNTISGGGSAITTYNPLAIAIGSTSQVTNAWSFIDHKLSIGTSSQTNSSAVLELSSTVSGFLGPRATDAQIAAITSKALNLRIFSLTKERQVIKRTDGEYLEAFLQDIKRDTSYQVTNTNLDLSGETTNIKNRYYSIRIFTGVTAAAAANNVITMPLPTADLLGVQFRYYIIDTSGDSDISQIAFGTDGVDGYLANGDGTYDTTFNLYPGFDVDVSVGWDANKGAYRWFLR